MPKFAGFIAIATLACTACAVRIDSGAPVENGTPDTGRVVVNPQYDSGIAPPKGQPDTIYRPPPVIEVGVVTDTSDYDTYDWPRDTGPRTEPKDTGPSCVSKADNGGAFAASRDGTFACFHRVQVNPVVDDTTISVSLSGSVDPIPMAVDDEYSINLDLQFDRAALETQTPDQAFVIHGTNRFYAPEAGVWQPTPVGRLLPERDHSLAISKAMVTRSCFCGPLTKDGNQDVSGLVVIRQESDGRRHAHGYITTKGDMPVGSDNQKENWFVEFDFAVPQSDAASCYSPTQNVERAYEPGAIGCPCVAGTPGVCTRGTALICDAGHWQAVMDGPCWPSYLDGGR